MSLKLPNAMNAVFDVARRDGLLSIVVPSSATAERPCGSSRLVRAKNSHYAGILKREAKHMAAWVAKAGAAP